MSKPGWRYDVKRWCMPTQSSKGQRIVSKRIKTKQETSRFSQSTWKISINFKNTNKFLTLTNWSQLFYVIKITSVPWTFHLVSSRLSRLHTTKGNSFISAKICTRTSMCIFSEKRRIFKRGAGELILSYTQRLSSNRACHTSTIYLPNTVPSLDNTHSDLIQVTADVLYIQAPLLRS